MKKRIYSFLLLLFITATVLGQSVPRGMNYQAVARDKSGEIIPNKEIFLKISLVGQPSTAEVTYYSEIHRVVTNSLGLFTLVVGKGSVLNGNFNEIPWSSKEIWMDIAIKDDGQSDYITFSNTKLLAVPYAYHAGTANELTGNSSSGTSLPWEYSGGTGSGNSTNGNSPTPANSWLVFGNTGVTSNQYLGTGDYKDLVFRTNAIMRLTITKDGDIAIANSLEIGKDLTVKRNVYLNTVSGQTINYGPLTVENGSPTTLKGLLDVTGATTLRNTLDVTGNTVLNSKLDVSGATSLLTTLDVYGASRMRSTLRVDNATTLLSTLEVSDDAHFLNDANIDDDLSVGHTARLNKLIASDSIFLNGPTKINNILNAFGQVTINVSGLAVGQDAYENYPLRVEGAHQGIAIKLLSNPYPNPTEQNNFISFLNSNGDVRGRIEGQSGIVGGLGNLFRDLAKEFTDNVDAGESGALDLSDDRDQSASSEPAVQPGATADQIFGSSYAYDAYWLTIGFVRSIASFGINLGACLIGVGIAGDCDDAWWSGIDMGVAGVELVTYIAVNESGIGVAYESGGADYAEWLQKQYANENFTFGDVVGVKGGMISKSTEDADKFMVISRFPAVIGGMQDMKNTDQYEKVGFMGQVLVKVMGKVRKGDYILPSGNCDGYAIAVSPKKMKARDYKNIVGISWGESDGKKMFEFINTAVGINTNDMAGMIDNMQKTMNQIQAALQKVNPEYVPSYYDVDNSSPIMANQSTTTSPSMPQTLYNQLSPYSNSTQAIQELRKNLTAQGFDVNQLPLLAQVMNNPTPENTKLLVDRSNAYLHKLEALMAQGKK